MYTKTVATMKMVAAFTIVVALAGGMSATTAAQTTCSEQPVLAIVDSNGDGIASVGEIRAVAPDNAELQAAASQLEAAGHSGIQYSGCGGGGTGSGNGSGTGTGNGSGTGTGSGTGSGTGTDTGTGTGSGTNAGTGSTSATTGGNSASATAGGASATTGSIVGPGGEAVLVLPGTGSGSADAQDQAPLALGMAVLALVSLGGLAVVRGRRPA